MPKLYFMRNRKKIKKVTAKLLKIKKHIYKMFKFFAIFIFLTLLGYLYDRYKFKICSIRIKYDSMLVFLQNNDKSLTGKP